MFRRARRGRGEGCGEGEGEMRRKEQAAGWLASRLGGDAGCSWRWLRGFDLV